MLITPLFMAVPVSANSDVLYSSDIWFVGDGISVPFPPDAPAGKPLLVFLGDGYITVYYAVTRAFTVMELEDKLMVKVTNYKAVFDLATLEWDEPVFVTFFYVTRDEFLYSLFVLDDSVSFDGIVGLVPSFPFPLHRNVGVFSVFSGVGTWLFGAVQNISTMFWTSEGGMTVLGYLAVASLAVAVILLIFYLIAGWLKFH